MSRPVFILAPGQWDVQHLINLTATQLAAQCTLDDSVDYALPDRLSPDIRLCRTQWPQKICMCRAYTLDWNIKDRKGRI